MPRYSPRLLPPYAHLPGRTPHPTRHPRGHSYGLEVDGPAFMPADAGDHPDFRYGLDLHNHGCFWECHECLEGVWRGLPRSDPAARFLQGVIQLSVAHSYVRRGRPAVSPKLAGWALANWQDCPSTYAACAIDALRQAVDDWLTADCHGLVVLRLLPEASGWRTEAATFW